MSRLLLPIPAGEYPARIDPSRVFGNSNPVELEIGSGKGLFLSREAARRPGVNFIGVEWSPKYAAIGASRLEKQKFENVRIYVADAKRLIPAFDDKTFQGAHIYFPDPWWKRRHKKRRMVEPFVIGELARVLADHGSLSLATDVEEYFAVMLGVVAADARFRRLGDPLANDPTHDLDYLTHFERRYRQRGQPVFRALFARQPRGETSERNGSSPRGANVRI